jgi:hypothetical protein
MSAEVLRQNLLLDLTTIAASTIAAAYPTVFIAASSVPSYINMCLPDLLGLTGGSSEFAKRVVATQGEATTPANACIVIQPTEIIEPYEADFIVTDLPGGETTYIDVLVKNVKDVRSIDLVKAVGLRIRLLLDMNLRGSNQTLGLPADLQVLNDTSIRTGYYKCEWIRSSLLTATEQAHRFKCSYIRVFI